MTSNKDKSEKDLLHEINGKLDKLIGLFAIQGKSKDDQIKILAALQFSNSEISHLTGYPKGTVDGIRAKIKKDK